MKPLPLLAVCLLCLTGCASVTPTTVTRFHQLSPQTTPRTFSVQTGDTLETRQYAHLISRELEARGWIRSSRNPAYTVHFECGISAPRQVQFTTPVYGQTGVQFTTVVGSSRRKNATYIASTYTFPGYSVVGTFPATETVYDSYLNVTITDSLNRHVFEGRSQTTGTTPALNAVMPIMIQAMFREFPGKSGETRTYNIPRQE